MTRIGTSVVCNFKNSFGGLSHVFYIILSVCWQQHKGTDYCLLPVELRGLNDHIRRESK